jgi:tetratricopeptide (TPR) repeat protein
MGGRSDMPTKREKGQQLQQATFVGRKDDTDLFCSLLPEDRLSTTDVLVIYGIAGIGKTELLKKFQQIAEEAGVPVAKIEPPTQKNIFGFLTSIHHQLQSRIRFTKFEEGLRRHQEIEARLLESDVPKTAIKVFAKGTHALLKLIPGANLFSEVVGSEQIEAAISHIYRAVGRTEGDFWMKPEDELTARLVADLNTYCSQHRLVLMIDHYEAIGDFDGWVRDQLFANLENYGILIIAGWHRLEGKGWQEHAPLMEQVELEPLTDEEATEYLRGKGITEPRIVEDIVHYAGGHPLALTMVAELAQHVHLKAGDLERVPERHRIIEQLIKRITSNVDDNLRAALEVCAVVRLLTEGSLAWMLNLERKDAQRTFMELRQFGFVKVRGDYLGIALHDAVWTAMNDDLRWRAIEVFCNLNERAANYYQRAAAKLSGEQADRYLLEHLYHRIQADERDGISLFQVRAEELVRYRLVNKLRALLNDVNTYADRLAHSNGWLWVRYYNARMMYLEGHPERLEDEYTAIASTEDAERKLKAYALCDLGEILSGRHRVLRPGGLEKALAVAQESLNIAPELDTKLVLNYKTQNDIHVHALREEWDKSLERLEAIREFYKSRLDGHGVARVCHFEKMLHAVRGDWHAMLAAQRQGLDALPAGSEHSSLYADIVSAWSPAWAWTGRYGEAEHYAREGLTIHRQLGEIDLLGNLRDLALVLALQSKYEEAEAYFQECLALHKTLGRPAIEETTTRRFWAVAKLRRGELDRAEQILMSLIEMLELEGYELATGESLAWLGLVYETRCGYRAAEETYMRSLSFHSAGRLYFICAAQVGLIRAFSAQHVYDQIPAILARAEDLAQAREYNDHLASLRLSRGQMTWDGVISDWGSGFDVALNYFHQALIHSLRYNRFLLDEVLSGRPQGTPLLSIIPYCLKRGNDGKRMLLALRERWETGTNDISSPRENLLSPIPEGISLLEAEGLARKRELGDGSSQQTVVEQIVHALS